MKKITFTFLFSFIVFIFAGHGTMGAAPTTGGDFQNILKQLRQSRQSLKDIKTQEIKEIIEEGKSQNKDQRKVIRQKREETNRRLEENRKAVVLKLIDIQINWFTRLKERVQNTPNISADLKSQFLSEADAILLKFNDFKSNVQNVSERKAMTALIKEIRDFSKLKREAIKKIAEAIHASRISGMLIKVEKRAAVIKIRIQELKNQGKNVVGIETEFVGIENKINLARSAAERGVFQEANENLKNVYRGFRDLAAKSQGL